MIVRCALAHNIPHAPCVCTRRGTDTDTYICVVVCIYGWCTDAGPLPYCCPLSCPCADDDAALVAAPAATLMLMVVLLMLQYML